MKITNSIYSVLLLLIILNTSIELKAQNNYPQNYFISPLDIPIILSGSFGELRSNHFHTGLDIKTQGVIGKRVLAAADGYVSRIKVSPWGYGNALYITHPNGYVSVYAHLDKYSDSIAKLVKQTQYTQQKFAIEIFPTKGQISVKQGELIAYSGNSGSSGGPHVHFEIRNGAQQPINPLLFGIKVNDNRYPIMRKLRIYNYYKYDNSVVQEFTLYQDKSIVYKKFKDTINISSTQFYPAIEGFDRFNGANNKNGYYKLEFYFDDTLYSRFTAEKISFSEKRYINSYIDYSTFKSKKQRFQRSLKEENTHLLNISNVMNNGIMLLNDSKAHKVKIIAYDFAGQSVTLEVFVKHIEGNEHKEVLNANIFDCNHENIYKAENFEIVIPKGAFYSSQQFHAKSEDNKYSTYSKLCNIFEIGVPLHKYSKLKIRVINPDSIKNKSKLCIISLNSKDIRVYEGGEYSNGWLSTKTRSFGRYYIDIDTIAPVLKPKNIYENKNITKQRLISFKVQDDLSGIKKYSASINNQWVLLEYDPKREHLYYIIDKHFEAGKHKFVISATDSKGNKTKLSYNLIRN